MPWWARLIDRAITIAERFFGDDPKPPKVPKIPKVRREHLTDDDTTPVDNPKRRH